MVNRWRIWGRGVSQRTIKRNHARIVRRTARMPSYRQEMRRNLMTRLMIEANPEAWVRVHERNRDPLTFEQTEEQYRLAIEEFGREVQEIARQNAGVPINLTGND